MNEVWKKLINEIPNHYVYGAGSQADRFLINQSASNGLLYAISSSGIIGSIFFVIFSIIVFFKSMKMIFLDQYKNSMDFADIAIVYFSEKALAHKKLEPIDKKQVLDAFGDNRIVVINDSKQLTDYLSQIKWQNKNLLMMSSGTFDGLSLIELSQNII